MEYEIKFFLQNTQKLVRIYNFFVIICLHSDLEEISHFRVFDFQHLLHVYETMKTKRSMKLPYLVYYVYIIYKINEIKRIFSLELVPNFWSFELLSFFQELCIIAPDLNNVVYIQLVLPHMLDITMEL